MDIWICIGIEIGISKIFSSVLGIKSIGKSGISPPLLITYGNLAWVDPSPYKA